MALELKFDLYCLKEIKCGLGKYKPFDLIADQIHVALSKIAPTKHIIPLLLSYRIYMSLDCMSSFLIERSDRALC